MFLFFVSSDPLETKVGMNDALQSVSPPMTAQSLSMTAQSLSIKVRFYDSSENSPRDMHVSALGTRHFCFLP